MFWIVYLSWGKTLNTVELKSWAGFFVILLITFLDRFILPLFGIVRYVSDRELESNLIMWHKWWGFLKGNQAVMYQAE